MLNEKGRPFGRPFFVRERHFNAAGKRFSAAGSNDADQYVTNLTFCPGCNAAPAAMPLSVRNRSSG